MVNLNVSDCNIITHTILLGAYSAVVILTSSHSNHMLPTLTMDR